MSIKVLVADDHEVVRRGLNTLFRDTEIKVLAEASNGKEAIDQTPKHKPDIGSREQGRWRCPRR